MADDAERKLPFSQRAGLAPIPPQLKLGEVSDELRRLLWYAVYKDFNESVDSGYRPLVYDPWRSILLDMHVRFLKQMPESFEIDAHPHSSRLKKICTTAALGGLFDFVEFLLRHPRSTTAFRQEVVSAFVDARAAYRVIDGDTIIAVGTDEQAMSVERAIDDAEAVSSIGARKHLIDAGKALARGEWAESVRESIHAVESIAVQLASDTDTLGSALSALAANGHLHGSLKRAFAALYGYTSDQEGVRHALVFEDEAKVDEADALFMLGACASFISYLIAKGSSAGMLIPNTQ